MKLGLFRLARSSYQLITIRLRVNHVHKTRLLSNLNVLVILFTYFDAVQTVSQEKVVPPVNLSPVSVYQTNLGTQNYSTYIYCLPIFRNMFCLNFLMHHVSVRIVQCPRSQKISSTRDLEFDIVMTSRSGGVRHEKR